MLIVEASDGVWVYGNSGAPTASGGLKASLPESERAGSGKTSTPVVNNGESNLCGAGQPFYPELSALLGGEWAP
jgi:hypothetical protein